MGQCRMKWLAPILLFSATAAGADHEMENRDLSAGSALYAQHRAACHGANLEGHPDWQSPDAGGVLPAPPHDASGHMWHHDNAPLFNYTKLGGAGALAALGIEDFNTGMPAYEGVTPDGDIWNILAYIRSTWPEHERDIQATRNPPH